MRIHNTVVEKLTQFGASSRVIGAGDDWVTSTAAKLSIPFHVAVIGEDQKR